jgi:hypothetical protein
MINCSPAIDSHFPVSISDLPSHDFSVTPDTLTLMVVERFQENPGLPGVLIILDGKLLGVITRLKLFERLGHRFGVELFLQKPIMQLNDLIRANVSTIPGGTRIEDAISYALQRPASDVYDPLVVLHDDGRMYLLDINLLLLIQSHVMASLSNIVGNLEQIDKMINSYHVSSEILDKILLLMRAVIPYHQAAILAIDAFGLGFIAHHGYNKELKRADEVLTSPTYQLIMQYRQAIYMPKAHTVPGWKGMEALGKPLAWMGVPILDGSRPVGLLSISRNVDRAFNSEERETALSFTQRIAEIIRRNQSAADLVTKNMGTDGYDDTQTQSEQSANNEATDWKAANYFLNWEEELFTFPTTNTPLARTSEAPVMHK